MERKVDGYRRPVPKEPTVQCARPHPARPDGPAVDGYRRPVPKMPIVQCAGPHPARPDGPQVDGYHRPVPKEPTVSALAPIRLVRMERKLMATAARCRRSAPTNHCVRPHPDESDGAFLHGRLGGEVPRAPRVLAVNLPLRRAPSRMGSWGKPRGDACWPPAPRPIRTSQMGGALRAGRRAARARTRVSRQPSALSGWHWRSWAAVTAGSISRRQRLHPDGRLGAGGTPERAPRARTALAANLAAHPDEPDGGVRAGGWAAGVDARGLGISRLSPYPDEPDGGVSSGWAAGVDAPGTH